MNYLKIENMALCLFARWHYSNTPIYYSKQTLILIMYLIVEELQIVSATPELIPTYLSLSMF